MILTIQSQNESLQHTRSSNYPEFKRFTSNQYSTSTHGKVISIETGFVHAPVPEDFKEIDQVIESFEKDPKRALALKAARVRLSKEVSQTPTLASLRLGAGLSQLELAKKLGNSQPSYSKIEAGKTDVLFSTFELLKEILNVSRDELATAIENSRIG